MLKLIVPKGTKTFLADITNLWGDFSLNICLSLPTSTAFPPITFWAERI